MRQKLIPLALLASLGLALPATAAAKKSAKPTPAPTKAAAAAAPAAAPAAAAAAPAAPAAGTVEATASPELVGQLTKQLGVTPKQAEGGAGAILGYAKGKMKVEDYAKVAAAVPGCDNLVKAAPVADAVASVAGGAGSTGGGSALGGAVSALGSQAGGAAGLVTAVTPAFQKLGLSGETVGKFAPIVLQYVTGKGGSGVGNLLGAVLK